MKHLLKFNESKKPEMTNKDFELIENCFLEYLDQTYQGEYVPSKTICGKPSDYIIFKFDIPHPQPHELITWSDSVASEQLDDYKSDENLSYLQHMHFVWSWVCGFIKQLSGDIKRCESYGFECKFHLDQLAHLSSFGTVHNYFRRHKLYLTVHHKGSYDKSRYVNFIHSHRVYVSRASKAYDLNDASNYANSKMVGYLDQLLNWLKN